MSRTEIISKDSSSNLSQGYSNTEKISDLFDLYDRGCTLIQQKRYEEAIDCYKKTQEIDPNRTSSWYNMGYALRQLGRYDEAIYCFDKVIEINPVHYWAKNSKDFISKLRKYLATLHSKR